MKVTISLTVNDARVQRDVEPRTSLADFLREELRLTATHLGCEHGVCGACTVMVDGAPARACIALAVSLDGAEIRTVEGFAEDAAMGIIKEAFHQEHGLQCGFCTPGMLISARDLIARHPDVDEGGIRRAISGNLCRCTGYQGIVRSIRSAARQLSSQGKQP
jgi:carbon-monoxide dehydrogenase small subunit